MAKSDLAIADVSEAIRIDPKDATPPQPDESGGDRATGRIAAASRRSRRRAPRYVP